MHLVGQGSAYVYSIWGAIMLGVACTLYLYLSVSQRDAAIIGVLSWASLEFAIKNQAEQVVWVSGLLVCVISLMALVKMVLFRGQPSN